jgi:hypothetical protein
MAGHSGIHDVSRVEANQNPEEKKSFLVESKLTQKKTFDQVDDTDDRAKHSERGKISGGAGENSQESVVERRMRFPDPDHVKVAEIPPAGKLIGPGTLATDIIEAKENGQEENAKKNDHSHKGVAFKKLTHSAF